MKDDILYKYHTTKSGNMLHSNAIFIASETADTADCFAYNKNTGLLQNRILKN